MWIIIFEKGMYNSHMNTIRQHVSPESAHVCDMHYTCVTLDLWVTCSVACVGFLPAVCYVMLSLSGDHALLLLNVI